MACWRGVELLMTFEIHFCTHMSSCFQVWMNSLGAVYIQIA